MISDGSLLALRQLLEYSLQRTVESGETRVDCSFDQNVLVAFLCWNFTNHSVSPGSSFLLIIVRRNANHIRRIDFQDHDPRTPKALQIIERTEMQTGRAGIVLIIVDLVARHRDHFPDAIIELTRMHVGVIFADLLVCEEISIFGDGLLS